MKKFSIEYHETYGSTYEIEAETKEEAEEYVMLSGAKGFVATAKVEWEE